MTAIAGGPQGSLVGQDQPHIQGRTVLGECNIIWLVHADSNAKLIYEFKWKAS